jgi:hypothetical protein
MFFVCSGHWVWSLQLQSSGRVSRDSQTVNIEKQAINVKDALASLHNKHLLAAGLYSADYILSCSAMESLLLVSGLESTWTVKAFVMGIPFMSVLIARLVTFYTLIPITVDPARLGQLLQFQNPNNPYLNIVFGRSTVGSVWLYSVMCQGANHGLFCPAK